MQHQFLHLVQQNPARTLHHALGEPRGARGVHDVERMIEGQLCKFDIPARMPCDEVFIADGVGNRLDIRSWIGIGHHDDPFDRRQLLQNLADARQAVDGLALKKIAVGRKKHLGLNLAEAIQHAFDTEVGRAGGPGGSQGRCRQHGDDGLRHVGHEPHDPVTDGDAAFPQSGRHPGHGRIEFGIGHALHRLGFTFEDNRRPVVPIAQEIFSKIESGPFKPAGAGHFRHVVQHPVIGSRGADVHEIPDRGPEFGNRFH